MSNSGLPLAEVLESVRSGAWGSDVATEERHIPVRVVRNGDISEDRRILVDNIPRRWVSEKELKNSRVTDRDILLVGSGYIGKSARLARLQFEEPVIASNFVRIVSPDSQTDSSWLFWLLGLYSATNYMQRISAGTSLQNLPTSFFKEWKIPYYPPLEKQRHIASVLDSVEESIEQTENVITKTEQLRDALLDELITRGVSGHHKERKEVAGTTPLWRVVKLGDIANVEFSNVDKKVVDGEIPVVLCNYHDVVGSHRIRSGIDFTPATATAKEVDKWTLRQDDVIFTKDAEIGKVSLVEENVPNLVCGYHLGRARPKQDIVFGPFLAEALKNPVAQEQITRLQTVSTIPGISLGNMRSVQLLLPPLKEQKYIVSILGGVDEAIEKIENVTAKTAQLCDALLHNLLTRGLPDNHND